jgi:hypothetical protein
MFQASKSLSLVACLVAIASAQTMNLKGRVLDAVGMQPVPGAMVKVTGTSLTAVAGADGRFVIKGSSSGIRRGQLYQVATPYLRGKELWFEALSTSEPVRVEFLETTGRSLETREYRASNAGWNKIGMLAWPARNFLGYARVTTGSGAYLQRILRISGSDDNRTGGTQWSSPMAVAPRALAKTAAGQVDVSMEKLTSKTVPFIADDADLGDIVLDYPARKLGVGATAPYGALELFGGNKGKAAAQAEMAAKWQDWLPATVDATEKAKYTAATGTWKVMPDPQYSTDTNHVTVQSCCNTQWGYDDFQTKETHGDVQIHVEFNCMGEYDATENNNAADGFTAGSKGYCNSGVYIQSRYEVQIFTVTQDSTAKPNDNHNWMSAIVGDKIPTANPNRKNGEWQSYDITFRTQRYDASAAKARISLWWNGKLVHDNVESTAPATGTAPGTHSGEEMNATLYGFKLQSEGRDVRFRNMWMKKLTLNEAKTNVGY